MDNGGEELSKALHLLARDFVKQEWTKRTTRKFEWLISDILIDLATK